MQVLLAVWRLLDRRQRRRLAAMQLLSVLMALSTVGGIAAVLPFFTVIAQPDAIALHPALRFLHDRVLLFNGDRFVFALGVLFAVGVVLSNLINLGGSLAMDRFAFRAGETLHTALFDEYLHRGYGFHAATSGATLTSNVLYETGRVAGGILRHGLILVSSMVTVLCIMASLVLLDPFVALASIVGLASSYAGVYAIARSKLRRNGEIESEDFAERTRIVSEGFGAVKELIVLQAQPLFVARLARCCRSISRTIVNNLAIAQSPKYLLEGVIACLLVGVALYSHAGGTSAASLIAHLSFVGLAVYRLLPALQQVFFAGVKIRADAPAFERIAADLQLALARKPAAASGGGDPLWLGRPHHAIHLRGVSFSHGHRGGPAIADLTLSIPSGTMIGFIGANGSGKTTLIDVVCGLLVPQSGRVDIDGVALDDANRRAWQSVIAYVPQQVFVCDASLAENVALGVKSPHIDQVRLRSAVRLARLEDCVAGLPDGYGGKLGGTGARLSGGQRQRLGIARALYRDASVIIMDEATSSLDLAAEREITDMLAELRPGRTMLLVAHRLNALRHCDVIHELENGRISSSGTFQHFRARAAGEYGLSEEAPQGAMQAPVIGQRQSVERLDEARCLAADRG